MIPLTSTSQFFSDPSRPPLWVRDIDELAKQIEAGADKISFPELKILISTNLGLFSDESHVIKIITSLHRWFLQHPFFGIERMADALRPLNDKVILSQETWVTSIHMHVECKKNWVEEGQPNFILELKFVTAVIATLYNFDVIAFQCTLLSGLSKEKLALIEKTEMKKYIGEALDTMNASRDVFYSFTLFLQRSDSAIISEVYASKGKRFLKLMHKFFNDPVQGNEAFKCFKSRMTLFTRLPAYLPGRAEVLFYYFTSELERVELESLSQFKETLDLWCEMAKGYQMWKVIGQITLCFRFTFEEWYSFQDNEAMGLSFHPEQIFNDFYFKFLVENLLSQNDPENLMWQIRGVACHYKKPSLPLDSILYLLEHVSEKEISLKLKFIEAYTKIIKNDPSDAADLVEYVFSLATTLPDLVQELAINNVFFVHHGDSYDQNLSAIFVTPSEHFERAIGATTTWWAKVLIHNLKQAHSTYSDITLKLDGNTVRLYAIKNTIRKNLFYYLQLLYLKTPLRCRPSYKGCLDSHKNLLFEGNVRLLWENESLVIVTPKTKNTPL